MTSYRAMLDTNIVSDLVIRPHGPVYRHIDAIGEDRVCISVLSAAELQYGILKRGSARLSTIVERLLTKFSLVDFAAPADTEYARIRDHLTRAGTLIGPVALFIAAHALALDLTLVTANIREFSRVPDLRVENWLD